MRKYLVSTGVLPMCVGKEFPDYTGIFEASRMLEVDGVELVFLPEWESHHPPLTPTSANWESTPKIGVTDLVDLCVRNDLTVPVVHINRDVGNMLCSGSKSVILEGQDVLDENLAGASSLRAEVAVLHMWDTYAANIELMNLFSSVYEVASNYQIKIAIENIPINDKVLSLKRAWELLDSLMPEHYGFTLDLNWCSFHNDFNDLTSHMNRVLNVHVQGSLSLVGDNDYTLVPRMGDLDIIHSLSQFCQLGYDGYITLEMNKPKGADDFQKALEIIRKHS